ncbi:MAG: hypothetical protein QF721_04090 [Verrucomicrobiota bacterium]|jgi:hypothetical protein|nr:hypothetical protein [Verrucomicrobiota bacterium]MDP7048609.1 hypothetical protein [Verrucomicrobiota bacterium]
MTKLRLLLLFGFCVVGLAKPLAGPLEGVVHLTFPLTKLKMLGIFVDARLYEYDPFLADFPATLVDQVEIRDLDLSTTGDSLLDMHFSATRKPRMNYYLSIRAYSRKGGTQYYFIDGFQKIFTEKDEDEIDLRLATRLTRKKPEGEPVHVGSGGGAEPAGKVTGIHRAVEIEWEGTDGGEFLLQKSDDLENWETIETVVGTGGTKSTFLRVEGRVQFWRLHRE